MSWRTENDARVALIDHARAMNAAGINVGKAGNLSLRWPRSAADGFLITPSALPYDLLEPDDIVWLSLSGGCGLEAAGVDGAGLDAAGHDAAGVDAARLDAVEGRRKPSSEWRLHRDILAARPQAGTVLHLHGPESAALACSARVQRDGVPAFHYMIAVAGGSDLRCAPYALFGTQALSDGALAALECRRACLLANHGLVVVAADPAAALALAIDIEGLCGQYRRLLALGDPVLLNEKQMDDVIDAFKGYGR